jgi:uracil-DNA glycosylase
LALHDKEAPTGKDTDSLFSFVDQEYAQADAGGIPVYPPRAKLFRAFEFFNPSELRVVLLGQDPYHAPGQAEGLSFSVPDGTKTPPSLKNIFKERESDLGIPAAGASPCLASWAKQGVLLLNTTLTVRDGAAGSHRGHGWERLTDCMLQLLGQEKRPLVFILWGADARKKSRLLTNPAHLILEAEHPSPLSAYRGFFGSRPFSAVNAYLSAHGYDEIDWRT